MYQEVFQDAESLEEAAELAIDLAVDDFQAERILVMSAEEEGFVAQATHGIDPRTVWSYTQISKGIIADAYEQGRSLLLTDAITDDKHGGRVSVVLAGLRSVMCVPLKDREERVIGLLYADNRIKKGAFTEEDLKRFETLGEALARQFEKLQNA